MAKASVESRITQTGSIGAVAAPIIGTITLLIALLPIEAFRTAILAQVSTDPRRAAAASSDRITAGTIFTLTGEGAVFPKISLRACLVADNAYPSVWTVAATFPQITFSTIRTVVTCQTAVIAESVIQTHELLGQVTLSPEFPLVVLVVIISLQGLVVVLHQGEHRLNKR